MKIAINRCAGLFSLSRDVFEELGIPWHHTGTLSNTDLGIPESEKPEQYRAHPELIHAIEKVGEERASGYLAQVRIITIPDKVSWEICEHYGIETIHECHRSWPE